MYFKVFILEFLKLLEVDSYFSESLISPQFDYWTKIVLFCYLLINEYYYYNKS